MFDLLNKANFEIISHCKPVSVLQIQCLTTILCTSLCWETGRTWSGCWSAMEQTLRRGTGWGSRPPFVSVLSFRLSCSPRNVCLPDPWEQSFGSGQWGVRKTPLPAHPAGHGCWCKRRGQTQYVSIALTILKSECLILIIPSLKEKRLYSMPWPAATGWLCTTRRTSGCCCREVPTHRSTDRCSEGSAAIFKMSHWNVLVNKPAWPISNE